MSYNQAMFLQVAFMFHTHSKEQTTHTDRGNKQISNFLAGVPFSNTWRQCNMKHGVALCDLPDPVKYGTDLPGT